MRTPLPTDPSDGSKMKEAVKLMRNAERIVVFTGAGMSADSGIHTFRGSTGLWSGLTVRESMCVCVGLFVSLLLTY